MSTNEIEKWVETLLLHSAFSIKRSLMKKTSDHFKSPRFKWVDPSYILEQQMEEIAGDDYRFWTDATRSALSRPLNMSVAKPSIGNDNKDIPLSECFQVMHAREARPEEWRGRPFTPERYILTTYWFNLQNKTWDSVTIYVGGVSKKLRNIARRGESTIFTVPDDQFSSGRFSRGDWAKESVGKDDDATLRGCLRMLMSFQFTNEYFWHADIGFGDDNPTIRIPMTHDRALKLFKLRDLDTDASRRVALLHWIMGHTRVLNRGEEEERAVSVKSSLRGVYDFGWAGLNVKLFPSESLLRHESKQSKSVLQHAERFQA